MWTSSLHLEGEEVENFLVTGWCGDWGQCGRGNGTPSCVADGGRHCFPHGSPRGPTGPRPAPVLRSFLSRLSLCCSLPLCAHMRAKSLQSCLTLCDRMDLT